MCQFCPELYVFILSQAYAAHKWLISSKFPLMNLPYRLLLRLSKNYKFKDFAEFCLIVISTEFLHDELKSYFL